MERRLEAFVIGVALTAGCGGRVQDLEASDASGAADARSDSGTPVHDGSTPAPDDAVTPSPTDAAPTSSLDDCFGEMGASNPATLKDLMYDWAECPGEGACLRGFRFNVGCAMELRRGDMSSVRAATANDADCELLRRWSTSERLLAALDPSSPEAKACWSMPEPGGLAESTIVGGTPYAMKTMFCEVEPFVTHRRCLRLVMERYFPPK